MDESDEETHEDDDEFGARICPQPRRKLFLSPNSKPATPRRKIRRIISSPVKLNCTTTPRDKCMRKPSSTHPTLAGIIKSEYSIAPGENTPLNNIQKVLFEQTNVSYSPQLVHAAVRDVFNKEKVPKKRINVKATGLLKNKRKKIYPFIITKKSMFYHL